jgi:Flp pilus assembly protein TadG
MVRRFWRDQDGQALLLITIMLPVLLGFVGLAIDATRFTGIHSELQNMADAAALAGAQQLDGKSDAITRATSAANTLSTQNAPKLSNVSVDGVQIGTPIFYRVLTGDLDPTTNKTATADVVTTDATKANYIKVTTIYRSLNPLILVANGLGQQSARATATASSTFVACNVQPLMLCNPNFPNDFSAVRGQLYGFTVNGNAPASPGNFNLLDPPGQTSSSDPDIRNLLSSARPNVCYTDNLSPDQGNKANAVAIGINSRFDIQPSGSNGATYAGMDFTPDVNTIKGDTNNTCMSSGSTGTQGQGGGQGNTSLDAAAQLPGGTNFTTTTGGAIYSTTMDATGAASYLAAHHSGLSSWPAGWTRYDMYKAEIAGSIALTGTEKLQRTPNTCANKTAAADRRLFSVAIVNCDPSNPLPGNSIPFVESHSYAQFFLTKPVDQSNIIWAEFVQTITTSTPGGQIKQIVQLVRDQ